MTRLLHEYADRHAETRPDALAVEMLDHDPDGGTGQPPVWTYRHLVEASNRVANRLVALGVGPGDRVGLAVAKGPWAIASMLAVSKTGAAYVPLDVASPAARLELIVAAAEPTAVLIGPGAEQVVASVGSVPVGVVDGSAPKDSAPVFTPDEIEAADAAQPPAPLVGPEDPAHILFTSGSTGTPKGVVITHRNAVAFVDWAVSHFGIGGDDRVSGHAPLHFDLSTFDVYGAFAAGASLHPVPGELGVNPQRLAELIRSKRLTQWFSVPTALNYLVAFDAVADADFPELRRLLWCGEVLPTRTLIALMKKLPHVEFTNLYGPTEATIASSWYRVTGVPAPTDSIPIGWPCDGEQLTVLDEHHRPVTPGDTGELAISGVGLSSGYWRDPDKTASAFIVDEATGTRWYRTGDLGSLGPDGAFRYLGRLDSQIKSRGYRIELGEIETALAAIDGLKESAVVAIPAGDLEGMTICAAFVPTTEDTRPATLRSALAEQLPGYMLPRRWLELAVLPKNVNGKIDRPALRAEFEADHDRRTTGRADRKEQQT